MKIMSRLFLFIVLCIHCALCNKKIGDSCQSKYDGKMGKCKPMAECEEALSDLKLKPPKTPTVCSFQQNVLTVCCPSSVNKRKRVEKCKEYAEYAFVTFTIEPFHENGERKVIRKNKCGRNGDIFIIGGEKAASREFPHSALLGYRDKDQISWQCGGSLVSSRYVLTAGHCLKSVDNGPVIKVRLGELDYSTSDDDATPQDFDIMEKIPHPEYISSRSYNDIALLKLSSQVKLSPYIRPICLPTENIEPKEYIATGWGYTSSFGDPSSALFKVTLQSFDFESCKTSYDFLISRKLSKGLQPSQLCAGHKTEKRDTCNGDSGGPLELYSAIPCSSVQIGVTSFGIDCASLNFPGVYTRVFEYADWIENIIWAPGEDM